MQPDITTVNHDCFYQDLICFRMSVEVLLNQAGQKLPYTFSPSLCLCQKFLYFICSFKNNICWKLEKWKLKLESQIQERVIKDN